MSAPACPPWCTRDHGIYPGAALNHQQLRRAGAAFAVLLATPDGRLEISVCHGTGDFLSIDLKDPVGPGNARALNQLLAGLGHFDLAEAVEQLTDIGLAAAAEQPA